MSQWRAPLAAAGTSERASITFGLGLSFLLLAVLGSLARLLGGRPQDVKPPAGGRRVPWVWLDHMEYKKEVFFAYLGVVAPYLAAVGLVLLLAAGLLEGLS